MVDVVEVAAHVSASLVAALESVAFEETPDVYAVSCWVDDLDDDPRTPIILTSVNTETQVEAALDGRSAGAGPPSDEGEARWNYAFWRQDYLNMICHPELDPKGATLVRSWFQGQGLWFDDEDFSDEAEAIRRQMTERFVGMCVDVVRDLHATGVTERTFGRRLPVLIHELEYYDEIAVQNIDANGADLVADFVAWVRPS